MDSFFTGEEGVQQSEQPFANHSRNTSDYSPCIPVPSVYKFHLASHVIFAGTGKFSRFPQKDDLSLSQNNCCINKSNICSLKRACVPASLASIFFKTPNLGAKAVANIMYEIISN